MRRAVGGVAAIVVLAIAGAARAYEAPRCVYGYSFPITITAAGSYRLCSNLVVPDARITAIVVTASNVTIDLAGYTIAGPWQCDDPATCLGPGGDGISGWDAENVTVLNGTIRGMGGDAIQLGRNARVEKVKVIGNGGSGISVGQSSIVQGCIAESNLHFGIGASDYATVRDSLAHRNGWTGIFTGCVSTAIGNASTSNGGAGIETGGVSGCAGNLVCENQGGQIGRCTQMTPNTCCGAVCPTGEEP